MVSLPFTTVDVFTKTRYTGNPLAIVNLPANHEISTAQMQTIAKEFNLSETVFIHSLPSSDSSDGLPEWRLRIFMTEAELPFAGHPTIGSACYALGTLAVAEGEGNGVRKGRLVCHAGPVDVEFEDGVARAGIPHNFHLHVESRPTVEEMYELQPGLRAAGTRVEAVDVVSPVRGMNFIAVRLASVEDLGKVAVTGVKPTTNLDKDWDVGFCASYFYVVTSTGEDISSVRTRMIEGTMEDPATGSAACGLACFLATTLGTGKRTKFEIVQGVEMGRRSEIGVEVELKEGEGGRLVEVERVVLSGNAVGVMEGRVEV